MTKKTRVLCASSTLPTRFLRNRNPATFSTFPSHLELANVVRPLEDGLEVLILGGGTPVHRAEVHLSGAAVDCDNVVLLELVLAKL